MIAANDEEKERQHFPFEPLEGTKIQQKK